MKPRRLNPEISYLTQIYFFQHLRLHYTSKPGHPSFFLPLDSNAAAYILRDFKKRIPPTIFIRFHRIPEQLRESKPQWGWNFVSHRLNPLCQSILEKYCFSSYLSKDIITFNDQIYSEFFLTPVKFVERTESEIPKRKFVDYFLLRCTVY